MLVCVIAILTTFEWKSAACTYLWTVWLMLIQFGLYLSSRNTDVFSDKYS